MFFAGLIEYRCFLILRSLAYYSQLQHWKLLLGAYMWANTTIVTTKMTTLGRIHNNASSMNESADVRLKQAVVVLREYYLKIISLWRHITQIWRFATTYFLYIPTAAGRLRLRDKTIADFGVDTTISVTIMGDYYLVSSHVEQIWTLLLCSEHKK